MDCIGITLLSVPAVPRRAIIDTFICVLLRAPAYYPEGAVDFPVEEGQGVCESERT